MRRVGLVAVVLAAAVAAPTASATLAWPAEVSVPIPSDGELTESVTALEPMVQAIEARIEPLEVETTDGAEQVLTLNSDILFGFDEAVLPTRAGARVGKLVEDLPEKAEVSVGGHTDSLGTAARNQTLSQQRAEAVAAVVRTARPDLVLTVKGFGSAQPIAPNTSGGKDDPDGRAKNRRVELRYVG